MIYIISIGIALLAILNNKSKIVTGIIVSFMFILIAYSYGNADFKTYEMYFRLYGKDLQMSVLLLNNGLFKLLCALFTKLNLNYDNLLFFISAIGFYNLYSSTRKYIKNKSIVFALYFIYPFIMDITQVRNFLAMSFLIKGCSYLIDDDRRESIIKFTICNLIATFLHITFIFYFLLILIKIVNKNNFKYIALSLLILEIVLFNFMKEIISLLTNFDKTEFYFSNHIGLFTFILIIIYYLLIIDIMFCISRWHIEQKWIFNIVKINLLMMLTLPLIYFSFEFIRLYRNIFFLNYIAVAYMIENNPNNIKSFSERMLIIDKRQIILLGMILITAFSLYLFIVHDYLETVFIPTFEFNRIFIFEK